MADRTTILDVPALAKRLNVREETVYIYRARSYLPPEDVMLGNSPGWYESTIDIWDARRPGKGWRKGQRQEPTDEENGE